MPNGSIQVRAFTSRAEIPLEGATVSITIDGDNSAVLGGVRVTNRDGLIDKVVVDTPPSVNSTEPFQGRGFAIFNIRVEHENYYTVLVRDAQVFPNITTIQNVEMIPLPENAPQNERLKTIVVPAQNL